MVGGSIKEFLDYLYDGAELFFVYRKEKYFIQGWREENYVCRLVLTRLDPPDTGSGYLWETEDKESMVVCAHRFLEARFSFFGGKTFLEIEEDVNWVDC